MNQIITGESEDKQRYSNVTMLKLKGYREAYEVTTDLLELGVRTSSKQQMKEMFSLSVGPQVKPVKNKRRSFLKKLHIF